METEIITVPVSGGRFDDTHMCFKKLFDNTVQVAWSGNEHDVIYIKPIVRMSRKNARKPVVIMASDGLPLDIEPDHEWVAYHMQVQNGKLKNLGALTSGRTDQGAYLNAYGIIW